MSKRLFPFLMWLIPLSFFTYQFILRLWPSLTMQQIMQQFAIDATSYGLLASVYYYGYSGFQIPIAIAMDKYGPRIILSLCALLCGIGMYLSIETSNWNIALLGRFLVGIGSAAGFLSTSKVISQYFSTENYSRMVGFSFSIGLLGAVYGGKPLSLALNDFGWYEVGSFLCIIAIIIGVVSFLVLRLKTNNSEENTSFKISDVVNIIKSPKIIALAIANLLLVGSLEGFADVWGVNYLVAAYRVEKSVAAGVVSFVFIGMIFGGPILAFISKYIGEYITIFLAGIVMSLCILYLLFISSEFETFSLSIVFFCIGMMCCYQVLVFTIGSKWSSASTLSLTIAFLNCINMLGGAFFHSIIGLFMDMFSDVVITNGIYSISAYQKALLIIPICALIGSIITIYLRKQNN